MARVYEDDDAMPFDRRAELKRFLIARRARLRPADVGMPRGLRRRVAGLRREEVAALAGVSVTWYTLLESGAEISVSREMVERIAHVLRLSRAEREYLLELALETARPDADPVVDELTLRALQAIAFAPAYLITTRWDVLAWNRAYALVWGVDPPGGAPWNAMLRNFTPQARLLHGLHWRSFAAQMAGMFRIGVARHPGDERYREMLEELHQDADFRDLWEAGAVVAPSESSHAEIVSPALGPFAYDVLNLWVPARDQQALIVQVPDAPSAEKLRARLGPSS